MGDFQEYFEMKRLYENLIISNRDVIQQLKDLIDKYASKRDSVSSINAAHSILPKCIDFNKLCGSGSAAVFGILLREYLTKAGWSMEDDDDKGRGKIYRRP